MTGAVYLCGGESGTGRSRSTACPDTLHDWPEPSGYVDASVEADWRIYHRWRNRRCPRCGLYGWEPGDLTELHVRRPAPT